MPDHSADSTGAQASVNVTSPQSSRRGRPPWLWFVVAGVAVLVMVLLVFPRHKNNQESSAKQGRGGTQPPVQVTPVIARKGDMGIYVNALGVVTPVNTVMVKSRVDGQLMNVNYVEGQMVHAGDSLVEIDARPFQAQLTQAEGQLARDRALLENALVDLERYQIAFGKNAIPKQQLDTQVATVHQYEGTVKFDEGQVESAKLQLVYSHIVAPISGRVGLRLVDAGNIVHATDTNPLAIITQLQPITVVFSIAEDHLPEILQQLAQGQKLAVDAFDRAQENKIASGTLLTLDNQIDTTTGTVKLKALFSNEDSALYPNQFVNAKLLVSTETNATLVPMTAIQRNAQGTFVYIVQTNQTVAMHPVSVGPSDGNLTAVQGLAVGETIASDNFNRLQEGAKVTVRKTAQDSAPADRKTTRVAAANSSEP